MAKSFGWKKMLAVGEVGVSAVADYWNAQGVPVKLLSEDPNWQWRDVDLQVGDLLVEVKTDNHKSENLFLELTCDGKPGCVFVSRADVWAVYYPKDSTLYWIRLPHLQYWLATHLGDYDPIIIKSHRDRRSWKAVGIAVPVAHLARDEVPFLTYNLKETTR